ncbi:hypothetical protein B566_EDAN004088 [Ephemera danica]|nr:hypothetical protein B566_EDAN004088 [Ephemera danica]
MLVFPSLLVALVLAQTTPAELDGAVTTTTSLTPPPWRCPVITSSAASCSCDLPHTLRCTGDRLALPAIADSLRGLAPGAAVSLLDCTVHNVTWLPALALHGVALHGLVVSSGELRQVSPQAFAGLATSLLALGLPNNQLSSVPSAALVSLPALERLDLSHNRLRALPTTAFKGLQNLTFVDLSENLLSQIAADTFTLLRRLRVLRLRGNRLDASQIAALAPQLSKSIEELDVSENKIRGSLSSGSMKGSLSNLRTLQMSRNNLTSVMKGALSGAKLTSLVSLTLAHNQIDVLEDDAFRALSSLTHLDLSHNRIVAVSGGSLAHLSRLRELRMAHNFLRTLAADLVAPLPALVELSVDDNDISIVQSEALLSAKHLRRITLSDNPLNCDCNLAGFATWLRSNVSGLPIQDVATAVCATPPSLENGLLVQVPENELVCGDIAGDLPADEPVAPSALFPPALVPGASLGAIAPAHRPGSMPVSGAKLNLTSFFFDGFRIALDWSVDSSAIPYTCDALFVYEEVGNHELLVESNPVHCNSTESNDPNTINIALPSVDLQQGHKYRYCLVLFVGSGAASDELALALGCSDAIGLIPSTVAPRSPRLERLEANITSERTVAVESYVEWPDSDCSLSVAVYAGGSAVAQQSTNCSSPRIIFASLPPGPYQVCGALSMASTLPSPRGGRCVTVRDASASASLMESRILSGILAAGSVLMSTCLLAVIALLARRVLINRRAKTIPEMLSSHPLSGPSQVFLHSMTPRHSEPKCPPRYVKLHATTKL